jgi:hypothetical protein
LNGGGVGIFCDLESWDWRHLRARATDYDKMFYKRDATEEEAKFYCSQFRAVWYKGSVENVLKSEREILGNDSQDFKIFKAAILKAASGNLIKPYQGESILDPFEV